MRRELSAREELMFELNQLEAEGHRDIDEGLNPFAIIVPEGAEDYFDDLIARLDADPLR